jgi:hypothetical protein
LPEHIAAKLQIVAPAGARLLVDGQPHTSRPLPYGEHIINAELAGYEPWQRRVNLAASSTTIVEVELQPDEATKRDQLEQARATRTTWAYSLGVAGIGAALGTFGLYSWNSHRYEGYRSDVAALARDASDGVSSPEFVSRSNRLQERAASIQRTDDIAVGLGVLAAGFMTTSAVVFTTTFD